MTLQAHQFDAARFKWPKGTPVNENTWLKVLPIMRQVCKAEQDLMRKKLGTQSWEAIKASQQNALLGGRPKISATGKEIRKKDLIEMIERGLKRGLNQAEIAAQLGKARSTITMAIKRHNLK